MNPRENSLKRILDAGDPAFGVLDNTYTPAAVELLGEFGFDFVWIDLEHAGPSPMDGERLDGLLRAAELTDTELLVRVPAGDPAMVRKVLDAGARNVFLSRADTAADVREAVEAAYFEVDGEPGNRGLAGPRAARYGRAENYPATEDEEVVVGVTLETAAAVENIDDILSVPQLGFVFAGPNDLSVSLGHPGERDHPDVRAAVETIRDSALDHGVPVGNLTAGMDDVIEKVDDGYQVLNVGSTLGALTGQFGDWHDRYENQ